MKKKNFCITLWIGVLMIFITCGCGANERKTSESQSNINKDVTVAKGENYEINEEKNVQSNQNNKVASEPIKSEVISEPINNEDTIGPVNNEVSTPEQVHAHTWIEAQKEVEVEHEWYEKVGYMQTSCDKCDIDLKDAKLDKKVKHLEECSGNVYAYFVETGEPIRHVELKKEITTIQKCSECGAEK